MISYNNCVFLCVILFLHSSKLCTGDLTPSLVLYSPGEPEYTEILVKREHDNLTLACELRGDSTPRQYVWNYMPGNKSLASLRPLAVEPMGFVTVSKLIKNDLQLSDSGQYMCSAPPFSITKYILVQTRGPKQCARGAFWCGLRCVLAGYVCDGRTDCVHGEDEDVALCSEHVCARADRLNCSSGRCVPAAACCGAGVGAGRGAPCLQPACCDEHARYQRLEENGPWIMFVYNDILDPHPLMYTSYNNSICKVRGIYCLIKKMYHVLGVQHEYSDPQYDVEYWTWLYLVCYLHPPNQEFCQSSIISYIDVEYPPIYEDRHAPDDYGFIQSTIYTVTACALIFMIAVVLLVSAICKMHMKRAALRSYAHADRATRQHYSMQYAQQQAHRFPPCYEASRLLEAAAASPATSPHDSPARSALQCNTECPPSPPAAVEVEVEAEAEGRSRSPGAGLAARLSAIFSSRYRQVPTAPQPADVELTAVRRSSLASSPPRTQLHNYRSPTFCDVNSEFYFTNPETPDSGRDLNFLATPVEFFRQRSSRRNTLERVMDQIDRQRLTLQLGRFQFTLPSFSRERRPDTPNVAEINIEDLDFIRSADTYTLNGRTIRLLGGNFENYPVLPDGSRPPPYTEAMRYKLYGPPPEYLSRDDLNLNRESRVDEDATNNIEMPPRYDDLAGGTSVGGEDFITVENNDNVNNNVQNGSITAAVVNGNNSLTSNSNSNSAGGGSVTVPTDSNSTIANNNVGTNDSNANLSNIETLHSVIDNLPAIDSDVNANDNMSVTASGLGNVVCNTALCNGNE